MISDISEQRKIEIELKKSKEKAEESEEKYKLLHENAGLGIGYYTPEGVVISFNSIAAKDMNGVPEVFAGKSIFDIFPKDSANFYFDRIQKSLLAEEITEYEDLVPLPNQDKWFLSTYTKIVDSKKKILGIQIISQNITEIKQFEIELKAAKEKAEESDRLKSSFLANMSHEIRTPMNGILGFTGLLKEVDLTGKERETYIGIIEKSGDRMLNTINDIIDISRIESGDVKLNIKPANINSQLESLYDFFKTEAEKKNIKLSYKLDHKNITSDIQIDT
jgi:PAS domain S-box-containing protein